MEAANNSIISRSVLVIFKNINFSKVGMLVLLKISTSVRLVCWSYYEYSALKLGPSL
jgi:hypothetical protein